MSVAKMKRVTLYGESHRKAIVLEWLQDLGCIHPTALDPVEEGRFDAPATYSRRNYEALRYLLDCPVKHPLLDEDYEADLEEVVNEVLANQQLRREAIDRIDEIEHDIEALKPWGDFHVPPPDELRGLKLWFYVMPTHRVKEMDGVGLAWEVVNRHKGFAYIVVVAEQEPGPHEMPASRVELPQRSLAKLRRMLVDARADREDIRAERRKLTRWIAVLTEGTVEAENRSALEEAASHTFDEGRVFVIRGWVPAGSTDAVVEFAITQGVACTVEDPESGESPPVLLVNRPALAPGEELVGFFQLPGYHDWDPSGVVFFSFTLFFAMIFSDAGYAALFGLVVLLFARRLGRTLQGKRIRTIGFAVTAVALVYGVMVGSYFGLEPTPGSFLGSLKILDVNDFDTMMRLCVVIGAAHVVLANAATAIQRGRTSLALAPLGWVAIILGGLGHYFKGVIPGGESVSLPATIVMAGGGVAVLFFSTDRPVKSVVDMLARLLEGLKGLAGVTTAFGDVLSYLRLFALGLSSASLALTFNQLAAQTIESLPGIGILLAIMIVVLGHALNAVLCVIGGLVHGLRLNLIEFYHWSIFDEGSPFRAFRKKEAISWTQ